MTRNHPGLLVVNLTVRSTGRRLLLETDEREDDVTVVVEWKGRRNEQLRHGRANRHPRMSKA
jgi:hypothetical protein